MLKHYYLLLALLLVTTSVFAAPITKEQAQKKAAAFAVQKGMVLSSKQSSVHRAPRMKEQDDSPYYIFDIAADGGFVIVSGDNRTSSIIGYTENGNYDEETLPENMKSWLQMIADRIRTLGDAAPLPAAAPATSTKHRAQGVPTALATISPLMSSTWNQGTPYWDNCPKRNGQRCYTGCTATAFAQVMYFYRWPEEATTSVPGYVDDGLTYSTLSSTTFNWSAMKNSYSDSDSGTTSGNAVAKLMHYMGKGAQMHYTPSGSGAAFSNAIYALENYFGYPNDIYEIHKDGYSSSDWVSAVYSELSNGRPVLIEGYSDVNWGGGHAFVCDGYRTDGCFHINWGWGGWCDGYFNLDILNPDDHSGMGAAPGGDGYYWHEGAVMNVRRPGMQSSLTTTDRGVATLYQDSNYGGYGFALPEGTFTLAQLRAYGIQNNDVSSLKVLPGYKVTLFDDDNFGGSSVVFTSNTDFVGGNWNDKATSVKIEPNGVSGISGVYKIQNRNSGKFLDLDGNNTANNTAIVQWDDEGLEEYQMWQLIEVQSGVYSIRSLASNEKGLDVAHAYVESGSQVILYPYNGYVHQQFILVDKGNDYYQFVARHCGKVVEIPGSSYTSGTWVKTWDNNGSSTQQWKIIPVSGEIGNVPAATVYEDIYYGGYAVQLPEGIYTLAQLQAHGIVNDDISSLKVQPGYKVTVYDGASFNGDSRIFTEDCDWVGGDWNDCISSIKIEAYGVNIDITDNGGTYEVSHTPVNNNESGAKLFDNTSSTKYCTFINASDEVVMTYHSTQSARLTSYTITSANDFDGRDPKNWRLEGSSNGTNWETIDTRSNQSFSSRFQKKTYDVTTSKKFSHYRLVVTDRKTASSTVFQIAEIELFGWVDQAPATPFINNTTAIEEITADDSATENATYNIYSIDGKLIKSNVRTTDGLPRGTYIINRKKVMIR